MNSLWFSDVQQKALLEKPTAPPFEAEREHGAGRKKWTKTLLDIATNVDNEWRERGRVIVEHEEELAQDTPRDGVLGQAPLLS